MIAGKLVAQDPLSQAVDVLAGERGEEALGPCLDRLTRLTPAEAGRAINGLLQALARAGNASAAARVQLALGTAHLAQGELERARGAAAEALALGENDGRAGLLLARVEHAAGDARAARRCLREALPRRLERACDATLVELATLAQGVGEPALAHLLERFRAERLRGGRADARLSVVARLARAMNSSLVGTAAPLHEVVRAILEETGAERGFLMLYADDALRFELGLRRDGSVLGAQEFRYSTSLVAAALEAQKAVVVEDLWSWPRFPEATSARELGLRSALCAPLKIDRRRSGALHDAVLVPAVRGVAGVLCVDATAPASFRSEDAPYFELLCDFAAAAVRAARTAESLRAFATAEAQGRATRGPSLPPPQLLEPADQQPRHPYEGIVTRSALMRATLRLCDRASASEVNVLVRGESGTGKELIARAIHAHGRRAAGPFVAVDCGALAETILAGELFGHESGAYTGADESRAGLLERAHGGTLFLDEVGEMSPQLQAALLRALQEGEVRRLGSERARPFDARVVAATHRDLRAMVERGEFRHDLYFRLVVLEVRLPPLRERRGDVGILAEHVLARMAERTGEPKLALAPEALRRLERHAWPGNVRELENLLESLGLSDAAERGRIEVADVEQALGAAVRSRPPASASPVAAATGAGTLDGTLDELERRAIHERLVRFGWNQVQTAHSLGIDRRTLYRKIRLFGLSPGGGR